MMKNILQTAKIIVLALALSISLSFVYAWTAPTVMPPGGNTAAPINTSATAQVKNGGLSVNAFSAFANSYFAGNVSIGTTNPGGKLTVSVPANSRGIESITATAGNTHLPWSDNWNYISGNGTIFRSSANVEKMRFDASSGNLDVAGTIKATGLQMPTGAGAGKVLTSDAFGNVSWQTPGVGGWGFGGMYTLDEDRVRCWAVNPLTGACSCPSGFTSYLIWGNVNQHYVGFCMK